MRCQSKQSNVRIEILRTARLLSLIFTFFAKRTRWIFIDCQRMAKRSLSSSPSRDPAREPILPVSLFLDSILSFTPPPTLPQAPLPRASSSSSPPPRISFLLETSRLCLLTLSGGSCQSLCHSALSHLPSHIKSLEIALLHFLLHAPSAPPTACHAFCTLLFHTLSLFYYFFLFLSSARS